MQAAGLPVSPGRAGSPGGTPRAMESQTEVGAVTIRLEPPAKLACPRWRRGTGGPDAAQHHGRQSQHTVRGRGAGVQKQGCFVSSRQGSRTRPGQTRPTRSRSRGRASRRLARLICSSARASPRAHPRACPLTLIAPHPPLPHTPISKEATAIQLLVLVAGHAPAIASCAQCPLRLVPLAGAIVGTARCLSRPPLVAIGLLYSATCDPSATGRDLHPGETYR